MPERSLRKQAILKQVIYMEDRGCLTYIKDRVEAIDKIIRYLDTVNGFEGFLQDEMVVDVVRLSNMS